jgi:aminopeptidase N
MRRFVREPLVHFALIGLGLFAIDAALSREEPDAPAQLVPDREPIVVDAEVRRTLAEEWTRTHTAAPTEAELDALVQDYIDDEVLYREGLARGLAENDPEIRSRVASQMAYVLSSRLAVPTPDDAELRAWFEQHADRFAQPERIDFTQVFVADDDDARAQELLRLLRDGADPNGLGDTFAGGRRFRGRKLDDLRERFGDAFATSIAQQREGEWALLSSPHGRHVVRVDRRTTASAADFEAVREQVLHAWQQGWRDEAMRREKEALRSRWEVVIE